MSVYSKPKEFKSFTNKKTSIGNGRRKAGSFKLRGKKKSRGQGKG